MIKLTTRNGNPIWFAPEHITAVELVLKDDEQTRLYTTETDEPAIVTEPPAEVARKVLEWKLAMIQYGARFQADANWTANKFLGKDDNYPFLDAAGVKRYIEHLAGLEETEHD